MSSDDNNNKNSKNWQQDGHNPCDLPVEESNIHVDDDRIQFEYSNITTPKPAVCSICDALLPSYNRLFPVCVLKKKIGRDGRREGVNVHQCLMADDELMQEAAAVMAADEHEKPPSFVDALDDSNTPSSSRVVTLDVGGVQFRTSVDTLCTRENGYFDRLFASAAAYTQPIFVDRNGELFHSVIAFLRDGTNAILPQNLQTLRELRREASFYGYTSLLELIDRRLNSPDRVIRLSVGGIEYPVTAKTLLKAPGDSVLHQLAVNENCLSNDDQGRPFIDRDGSLFGFILEYLRAGEFSGVTFDFHDRTLVRRIEKEARYYRTPAVMQAIYDRIHPWRRALATTECHRTVPVTSPSQTSQPRYHQPASPINGLSTPSTLRPASVHEQATIHPQFAAGECASPSPPAPSSPKPVVPVSATELAAALELSIVGPQKKLDTVSI